MDRLREVHRNLGHALLGRLIERSPLPFGRHHWVACTSPADLEIAGSERPRNEVTDWIDEQIRQPIDPEWGPAWRLAVQPLPDGGAAVTLIASHTICDGLAFSMAVADAVRGVTRDLGYPPPNSRTRRRAIFSRMAAKYCVRSRTSPGRPRPRLGSRVPTATIYLRRRHDPRHWCTFRDSEPVMVPAVAVFIDDVAWDQRAETLGGTSNSLFVGVVARLGAVLGWVDDDGFASISPSRSTNEPRATPGAMP